MKLIVQEEGSRSELVWDRPTISIGRAVDNDVRLLNTRVSRHHCRLERGSDGPWLVDLGSANGTSVNGQKVDRTPLKEGDRIQIGSARIVLEAQDAGSEARTTTGELGLRTLSLEARSEHERLVAFARIARELVRETELAALLRLIVDAAIELPGAERGFLLLAVDHGAPASGGAPRELSALKVRVARSFDGTDIPVPQSRLSLSVATQVFQTGEPLLSVDAGRDERLSGMASVEDLRLRSVMCVPVRIEGQVEGVLYLDHRLQQAAFDEEDLELVDLIAHQAAIAILNARRVAELRDQNVRLQESRKQIERLNEQLGRKVRDRDTELAVVRAALDRERGRYDYTAIVGASDGMRQLFQRLDRIIESDLPVLIQGESGTGKELIARAIHFNGARAQKPFVTENCAALPDTLLESELFGHSRGAFTGAHKQKRGLLEQADGGTLFLDEIGDMSAEMQKKLLRVLQEGEFRPVGSDTRIQVNVRLLAASHKNLEELVSRGEFREDLYYRVHVLAITLPPLRERREDVPLLADSLLARAARDAGRAVPHLPQEVIAALVSYDWPGNVRELENEMRRLVVLAQGDVRLEQLSTAVLERKARLGAPAPTGIENGDIRAAVADLERRSIELALSRARGNKSRAAAELGISRFALQRKLDKYHLGTTRREPHGEATAEGGELETGNASADNG
ncbi:MAG: sigma 54-interacting transcriptional regulator [Planctomycetota bacterium]